MHLVFDLYDKCGFNINRVVMTSGLAQRNPLVVQIMADVLGREIEVPDVSNPTARGAAIHGAVAAGLIVDFSAGFEKFGAKSSQTYHLDKSALAIYSELFGQYEALSKDPDIAAAMKVLNDSEYVSL